MDFYVNSPGSINKRHSVVETAHVHRQRASFITSALWGAWFLHLFLLCCLLCWRQPKYSPNGDSMLGANRTPGDGAAMLEEEKTADRKTRQMISVMKKKQGWRASGGKSRADI